MFLKQSGRFDFSPSVPPAGLYEAGKYNEAST